MRTFAVPALLFLIAIAVACQDTPQPLAVDSAAPRAQLMSHIEAAIVNDGRDYEGRIIVITDHFPSSATHCGVSFDDWDVVIMNPGKGPGFPSRVGLPQTETIRTGDRFKILTQVECDGRLDLTLKRITSGP